MTDITRIPKPVFKPDEEEQKRLALRVPPFNKRYDRARAVIKESGGVLLSPYQKHDLAEALAELGRFDEAAALGTPRSEFYKQVWEAVWADDGDRCNCPQIQVRGKQAKDVLNEDSSLETSEIVLRHTFTVREVFSVKHGAVYPLVKCNLCGYLNVYEEAGT